MKKLSLILLIAALLLTLLTGCASKTAETTPAPEPSPTAAPNEPSAPESEEPSSAPEATSFRLATLKGPTTMGLVKLLQQSDAGQLSYTAESTIYGAADEISALIIGGSVDIAAVPCNLASILYNKTEGAVQVIAINNLGVLNVLELGNEISSIADLRGKTIYSTGKGTTPEYTLNAILRANGLEPGTDVNIEYKAEATEIAALLAGDTAAPGTIAVLPQPYATTVLMQNPSARIALDLTQEWTAAGLDGKLVTGVFVVRRDFAEQNPTLISSFLTDYAASADWVNANTAEAAVLVAELGIVANPAVAQKALPNCAIVALTGSEIKTDVSSYLTVLFDQNPQSVGGALPDADFYYDAAA
ncbi:MAG: ABC transporter substrate-binding protein [Oscillospiraceae bacterium]|jgi:NitT/TauT family transport system substrate-binding protein|nr:ABC transporter substrate-binding protein [Oscillospiraceae bacterium]